MSGCLRGRCGWLDPSPRAKLFPLGDHVALILDDKVRQRLSRRYGSAVGAWLDAAPALLGHLAQRLTRCSPAGWTSHTTLTQSQRMHPH
jgi:hypothetical protein